MNAQKDKQPKRLWVLTPTLGICLFGLLYLLAACQYPGGSNADRVAVGFSWQNNYWCDLLGDVGKNGAVNAGRPIAVIAMLVLCGSLSVFWWSVPYLYSAQTRYVRLSQWAGVLSMFVVSFIGTPYHDIVMNIAGCFGLVALIATFLGLYRSRLFALIAFGVFCMLLILLNNYVYYSHQFIVYLPVIQKVTFVLFLLWIVLINQKLYRKVE